MLHCILISSQALGMISGPVGWNEYTVQIGCSLSELVEVSLNNCCYCTLVGFIHVPWVAV